MTTVGNSTGVVLPKEVLVRLNVEKGDNLFLTDAPDGYRITAYDPDFERQMTLVRRVMNERRNVLKKLDSAALGKASASAIPRRYRPHFRAASIRGRASRTT